MAFRGRRRLGDLLLEAGLLTEQQLNIALNEQRKWGGRLGRTIVELGLATETAIAQTLAVQLGLPSIDLDTQAVDPNSASLLRLDLCERYGVFPIALNSTTRTLSLATSDPTNLEQLHAIEFATNSKLAPVVTTASSIERAIRRYYFGEAPSAPRPPPGQDSAPAPDPASPPEDLVRTSYELDELLGGPPRETGNHPTLPASPSATTPASKPTIDQRLTQELAVIRERLDSIEDVNAAQVRALRVLLELLIESGLVERDEYLNKLHGKD